MLMRTLRCTAVVVAVVVTIVGVGVAPVPASAKTQAWDPRIEDLAHDVEELRGLDFDHPVPVRVLDDATFDKRYSKGQDFSKSDRKSFDRTVASMRAVGLLDEPVDIDSFNESFGSHVLGYYDDDAQVIVVRGDTFQRPSTRVTLAHELTHALQDQNFNLRKLFKKGRATESAVPRALVEGDATRIEDQYKDGLSDSERDEIDADNASALDEADDIPPIIGVTISGSYYLGEVVTTLLDADGGQRKVDDAFRHPPLDDIALIDPAALLEPSSAKKVPAPQLSSGERALGKSNVFGAWGLYLVLASRLPTADALAAAERWGGDSYITFERGPTPCLRVAFAGRNGRADAQALDAAIKAWAAAAPSDATTVVDGDTVTLTSCAPTGGVAPVSEGALARALIHVALRNGMAVSGLQAGLEPDQAKCLGTEVLAIPEVSTVLGGFTSLDDEGPANFESVLKDAVTKNAPSIRARCV